MFQRICVVMVLFFALGACGGGGDASSKTTAPVKERSGPPPWPLGDNQAQRTENAGLPLLTAEGDVVHYHAHLDVFYNGESVLVPAGIGIDLDAERISPLHTHQPSGILHVEANEDAQFTIAQVLTMWGVKPDLPAKVYVNGTESPRGLGTVLRGNTQIALVFGTPPAEIPTTYDCKRSPQDACDKIPQP